MGGVTTDEEVEERKSGGTEKTADLKAVGRKEFLVHMLPTFLPQHRVGSIVPIRSGLDDGKPAEKWIEGISAYVPRVCHNLFERMFL